MFEASIHARQAACSDSLNHLVTAGVYGAGRRSAVMHARGSDIPEANPTDHPGAVGDKPTFRAYVGGVEMLGIPAAYVQMVEHDHLVEALDGFPHPLDPLLLTDLLAFDVSKGGIESLVTLEGAVGQLQMGE